MALQTGSTAATCLPFVKVESAKEVVFSPARQQPRARRVLSRHDAADVSILDPMPSWFVTDAFMNVPDTGEWVLTVEVATHQTRAGIHRWFIRAMP